jgi:hypothetical protein
MTTNADERSMLCSMLMADVRKVLVASPSKAKLLTRETNTRGEVDHLHKVGRVVDSLFLDDLACGDALAVATRLAPPKPVAVNVVEQDIETDKVDDDTDGREDDLGVAVRDPEEGLYMSAEPAFGARHVPGRHTSAPERHNR